MDHKDSAQNGIPNSKKRPISAKKLEANRKNAQRSTGPTTKEGKDRSKLNSYKHGFFARQLFRHTEQGVRDRKEYNDLIAGIWAFYQPEGYMEGLLVEKIIAESVRFSRLLWLEQDFLWSAIFQEQAPDRILRYQATINRQLYQAIEELENLQDKRKARESEFPAGSESNGTEEEPTDVMSVVNGLADLGPPIAVEDPYARSRGASGSKPNPAANYGTNPPESHPNGPGSHVNQGQVAPRKSAPLDVIDRVAGFTPEKKPDGNPPSDENGETKPPNAPPDDSSKDSEP
jgi:hypothetical protein